MSDNTIALPPGITTGEQVLAYMAGVTEQVFGTPGTLTRVSVGSNFAQVTIVSPQTYKQPSITNPPQTVASQPWIPPTKSPPPETPWPVAAFEAVLAGSVNWYWGSPCSYDGGGSNDFFLVGGQVNGVPCVAKASKLGGPWTIVNNTVPFVIQQMLCDNSSGTFVGRGAGQSYFLQSTNQGVTWTSISDTPEYLGGNYAGFYG